MRKKNKSKGGFENTPDNLNGKKKKKKRSKLFDYILAILLLMGILLLSYPIISRTYYNIVSTRVVNDFEDGKEKLTDEEIERKISLAKAYNESLRGGTKFLDPYVHSVEEGVRDYARMLEVREKIGVIKIPKISLEEPIYAGTTEEVLQKGIGHLEKTSLPVGGRGTHTVLTGHRGLPTAKLFTDLNKVNVGDIFYIENVRDVLAYKVVEKKIVEPDDFSSLMVDPKRDLCTLLTCHPYMINSHRMLLISKRVPFDKKSYNREEKWSKLMRILKIILLPLLLLLILLLILYILTRKKKKRKKSDNSESKKHEEYLKEDGQDLLKDDE